MGNYHAAFNRAGYDFYVKANEVALTDSVAYQEYLANALTAFGASLKVSPFNEQAAEFFPLLLVQAYKDQEAKDFLSSLEGNVPPDLEEQIVYNCLRGIVRAGITPLALEWIAGQIEKSPGRQFYYQVQFTLLRTMGRVKECEQVMKNWEAYSNEIDPEMQKALADMRLEQRALEAQEIRDLVEGNDGR